MCKPIDIYEIILIVLIPPLGVYMTGLEKQIPFDQVMFDFMFNIMFTILGFIPVSMSSS